MHVLILGGTQFLGRHLVESLQRRGHEVTLFNRGKTNRDLFPDVERIVGDRSRFQELESLRDRRFDAVIDTCGYLPRDVDASARAVRAIADRYVFISTISVYDLSMPNPDENAETPELESGVDAATFDDRWYGQLKRLCERRALETFGVDRTLVVRPGLLVGPYDPTDRFTYWPRRAARGGTIVAPVGPKTRTQFIDARDLALWVVSMLDRGLIGTYNATSKPGAITFGDLLQTCAAVSGIDSSLMWCSERFLQAHGVEPWSDLPAWISTKLELPGLLSADVTKALGEGLTYRSIRETVTDTLAWAQSCPDRAWKAGLSAERERAVIEAHAAEQQ